MNLLKCMTLIAFVFSLGCKYEGDDGLGIDDDLNQKITCDTQLTNRVESISKGSANNNPCVVIQGKVKCWGENIYGQLGLGDTQNKGDQSGEMGSCLSEINLGLNFNVAEVVGSNASNRCALSNDGKVKCWGLNGGRLGLGDLLNRTSSSVMGDNLPILDFGYGLTAQKIAAGHRSYCAILNNGRIKCWGSFTDYAYYSGNSGFVGDTAGEMGDSLGYVSLPVGRTAKKISMNAFTTCAVLDDNSLYCWQYKCDSDSGNWTGPTFTCSVKTNNNGAIPLGSIATGGGVSEVAIGSSFACAILLSGQVRCWGQNDYGQLGLGDTIARASSNAGSVASVPILDLGSGRSAHKISAGSGSVCVILDNGMVKCWGQNNEGQLGLGDIYNRGDATNEIGDNLPYVDLGTGRTALDINVSLNVVCVLLDNNSVKCWGQNSDGRLGQGDNNPRGTSSGTMGDSLLPISF